MYEASFGLKRRPFAATPDATCFLNAAPVQAALDELVVCVEQGQGIAVLTAPAGAGKTLLCERLRQELDDRFETVLLRHASFLTRRALLQTVLCELNYAYNHPSEQELRLELFPAIRALQPKREALVLICDEAHQLNDSLLEELRILADFAEAGRPLVRLVLAGQLSLEEKLTEPSLEAFNQRIRAQVSLATFDQAGSLDYIDYRLTWAGGRTDETFTPEALDLIARASDGVPRCINQLADHTLLLGFVAEQRPVTAALVREALSDLRQLPLHWNEPTSRDTADQESVSSIETSSHARLLETSSASSSYSYEPTSSEREYGSESSSHSGHSHHATAAIEFVSFETDSTGESNAQETAPSHSVEIGRVPEHRTRASELPEYGTTPLTDSSISRRLQFHDLLRDAYIAAKQPISMGLADEPSNDEELHSLNTSDSFAKLMSTSSDYTTGEPTSKNVEPTNRPMNTVYEEVIVDRYAAIDAGFAPPAVSQTDTSPTDQVRAGSSDNPVALQIGAAYFSAETSSEPTVESFATSSALAGHCNDDEGLSETDDRFLNDSTTTLASSLDINDTLLITDEVPQFVASFAKSKLLQLPAAKHVPDELDQHLATYHDAVKASSVEQIADEIYSLGQSLRPMGGLSDSAESILNSLQIEVADLQTDLQATVQLPPPVPTETAWESVETAPVEKSTETRPFRYLFSLLRRKQQGLA